MPKTSNTPTASSQTLALIAFVLAGAFFTNAKTMRTPMTFEKRTHDRIPGPMNPKKTSRRGKEKVAMEGLKHHPITLQTATTPKDTEQAWRTVRSHFGMEIFIEFDLGTPGQTLRILIDSGSDWFWVTSEKCRQCGGIKRYDHTKSETYKLMGEGSVFLQYGSGSCSGDHIQESVCLSTSHGCSGFFCEPVCVTDMNIMAVNEQGVGLQSLVSDGLMGLSPVKIGDNRPDLFIELAYDQGVIDEKVFSLNFAGDYSISYLTVGGYDAEEFAAEEITWHDNQGQYFWAVSLEEVSPWFPEGRYQRRLRGATFSADVIVDSGSSYLLVPEKYFWDFFDHIQEAADTYCEVDQYNTIYCILEKDTWDRLPEMTLTMDGKEYRIPRESLYMTLEDYDYDDLFTVEMTYISGWEEWLLGLTFFENYYAVYDMEKQAVGFALSKTSKIVQEMETDVQLLATPAPQLESAEVSSMGWQHTAALIAGPLIAMGLAYKMCKTKKTTPQSEEYLLS